VPSLWVAAWRASRPRVESTKIRGVAFKLLILQAEAGLNPFERLKNIGVFVTAPFGRAKVAIDFEDVMSQTPRILVLSRILWPLATKIRYTRTRPDGFM